MGHCESGKYCRFSHIKPHESPKLICSYFLKGTCKFGNRCLLSHDLACPRQTPNFTSDSTSNGREGSLSAKKQNAGRLSTSLEQKPDPKMTTDSVEPTHVSSSEDPNYDKLLFGDEEDADEILNMIGEELKNHCSISSSMPSSAIDVNVDFECSINSKAEQEAAPRSGTDYSRLARMYTLNPNVSTQSRQTVIVEELPQEPVI